MNTQDFINKAKSIHGDKYDYSKTEYVNSKTKVCIICPEHGEFWQEARNHTNCKQGCPKCGKQYNRSNKKLTTLEFIEKAKKVHGNKYNYSKVVYINNRSKVCIICSQHGEFWQEPYNHLKGFGCCECGGHKKYTNDDFISKANKIHNNKYDYSKVEYVNTDTKVIITCPEHGDFLITPHHHLNGVGCTKCCGNYSYTTEEVINLFKKVHGDLYDYSNVIYSNTYSKVSIVCKKHGLFKQSPKAHLAGQGCPICKNEYTKSEAKLFENIKKYFPDTIHHHRPDFLKTYKNGKQEFDIFIPSLNVAIEYQGKQHFEPVSIFGGEKGYERMKFLDVVKYNKCKKNDIKLYYFSYEKNLPVTYLSKIYCNEEEIINDIKNEK